jgi:hypothetical protein
MTTKEHYERFLRTREFRHYPAPTAIMNDNARDVRNVIDGILDRVQTCAI